MSEKPQTVRADGQEDLLEQIFTQGLEKLNTPAQATATEEVPPETAPSAPKQETVGDAAHPANRKSKRSAVYLYLLVLFGAAFLMLLLAYFIQRRSSEDLRESMNLSREELLEQISALEEQNAALNEELDRWKDDCAQWQEQYEKIALEADKLWGQSYADQQVLYSWRSFWTLEQYHQAGDYKSCAAVLLLQKMGQDPYSAPDAERQEEIVRAVIDAGILDENYELHPNDYNDLLDAYFSNGGYYVMISTG